MDKVEKLSVGVAKMELEHHARGEVIKHLREEREDHRAASLRIRTLLAPLLGVDVNNEPADEMVGRFVALYEARDERVAEQRGHDKAMGWAATLAFDFDPFSEDWTDEQRGAGERVMGLFAERLRDEVAGGGIPPIEADQNLVERGAAAGYREASTSGARCIRDDGVELKRTETGFVDDRPYVGVARFRHSMGGPVVHEFSSIGADTARCGFLSRGPYTPSAGPTTCPGCLDPDRYCLQHAHMGWPRTLKVDCTECSPMLQAVAPVSPATLPESPSEATSWTVAVGVVKEVASPLPGVKLVVDPKLPEGVWGFTSPAMPRGMATVQPTAGFYRVYDSNQTCAAEALYVKVTSDGVVWGYSEYEGVPGYRTLGRPWVSFATEPGNERMRWMPDRDRVAEQESLRAWNPPLVPAPSLDGGLTNEEVAAVRALLKREGE